ncbi:hypothetical protein K6U06_11030 [Acidiferrimicrobium sp. IK]|uniref:hypothetical protein n=1 Tax=Acidiferrimicrobium sp. IK TaxID=2871700 RepID=UPI0021CAEE6C|nr:hypothetical protein [Acidiferrimicrobium sp. IK]MCU4184894.1 hypothetical protein [Acidiferrimicrobium sp. IK]
MAHPVVAVPTADAAFVFPDACPSGMVKMDATRPTGHADHARRYRDPAIAGAQHEAAVPAARWGHASTTACQMNVYRGRPTTTRPERATTTAPRPTATATRPPATTVPRPSTTAPRSAAPTAPRSTVTTVAHPTPTTDAPAPITVSGPQPPAPASPQPPAQVAPLIVPAAARVPAATATTTATAATVGSVPRGALSPAAPAGDHTASGPAPHQAVPDYRRTIILASGAGPGPSLSAATDLGVPIVFGALVSLFLLVQYVLGRRDPRLAEAPARGDEDSVPFE